MPCSGFHRTASTFPFIRLFVLFELCRTFSFFGIQAVLFLFLKHDLKYQLHNAVGIYHSYLCLSYMTPLVGTLVASLYVNKAKTILFFLVFGLVGSVLIVTSSVTVNVETKALPYVALFLSFGLVLTAIGVGCIREVVHGLVDDQFDLDTEYQDESLKRHKENFFEIQHYCKTVAMIAAFTIPPILRMQVECFGHVYCYPLAILVPTVFIFLAILCLIAGYSRYFLEILRESVLFEFFLCIQTALANMWGGGAHWIDNASHVFEPEFLDDVKLTLHVLALYLPLPIFWALFEQMGSRWVYQASEMDGTVDFDNKMYVEPEQMIVLNPLIIMVFLPVLESVCYPAMRRIRLIHSPKVVIFVGSLLAIAAFISAGFVEYRNEESRIEPSKPGQGEVIFFNAMSDTSTQVSTSIPGHEEVTVAPMDVVRLRGIPVVGVQPFRFTVFWSSPQFCMLEASDVEEIEYMLAEQKVVVVVPSPWIRRLRKAADGDTDSGPAQCSDREFPTLDMTFTDYTRCDLQLPKLGIIYYTRRVLFNKTKEFGPGGGPPVRGRTYYDLKMKDHVYPDKFTVSLVDTNNPARHVTRFLDPNHAGVDFSHVHPTLYSVAGGVNSFRVQRGGVYILLYVFLSTYPAQCNLTVLSEPNSQSLWWQVPQYVLISLAEFMFPLTLLEYSFDQVPPRMQPVLVIFWFFTIGLGNLTVLVFSFSNTFTRELDYYILFASLMLCDCALLLVVLFNYIPVQRESEEDDFAEK